MNLLRRMHRRRSNETTGSSRRSCRHPDTARVFPVFPASIARRMTFGSRNSPNPGRHLAPSLAIYYGGITATFFLTPPSCLRKNGTPASVDWSRRACAQSRSMPLARGPLSPPTITHCNAPAESHGLRSIRSSNGSADTNRIDAGRRANTVSLGAYFWLSTEVPIHTLGGQPFRTLCPLFCHQATARPGLLVKTWNTCPCFDAASSITENMSSTKAERDGRVEHIGHAVHKDVTRFLPRQRRHQAFRQKSDIIRSRFITMDSHCLQTEGIEQTCSSGHNQETLCCTRSPGSRFHLSTQSWMA